MNYFDNFQSYLTSKGYAESTIKHYSTELNGRIKEYAPKHVDDFVDLFEMPSSDAKELINKLLNDADFLDHTKPSHKAQVQGLKQYYYFLETIEKK